MTDAASSWRPVDLAAFKDAKLPDPSIAGIVYPGSLSLHYGEPESVKTWLNLIVCLEQIRGGHRTVWVDFEMSAVTITARLHDLGATDDELARFLYLQPTDPIGDPRSRADLLDLVDSTRPSLCVIDAMAGAMGLHGLDGNKADDVERFYNALTLPLRSTGAACVVIDHVTKDRETRGRWPIGSQRKLGAADVGLSIETTQPFGRGRTGTAKLRVTKDRHGALPRPTAAELELVSDTLTSRITWTFRKHAPQATEHPTDEWKPTVLMDRILTFLATQKEPVKRNAIVAAVQGRKQYILQAIGFLLLEAQIAEAPGRGLYIPRFPVPERFPPVPGTTEHKEPVPGSPLYTAEPEPEPALARSHA